MSVEGKIILQRSQAAFINKMKDEIESPSMKIFTVAQLQSKLSLLENYWRLFEDRHTGIITKDNAILDLDYVKLKIYDDGLQNYSQTRTTLIGLIQSLDKTASIAVNFPKESSDKPNSHKRQLPLITLPTFSGGHAEWLNFKELFLSNVMWRHDLSEVEKIHFLKKSLTKEPSKFFSSFLENEDSLVSVWEKLVNKFENEPPLIYYGLSKLFSIPRVINRTSKEFNDLLNATEEALNGLKLLNRQVQYWDDIVVFLMVSRLDSLSKQSWDKMINTTSKFPSL